MMFKTESLEILKCQNKEKKMNNTEILIVPTEKRTIEYNQNKGYGITLSESVEHAVEHIYKMVFDIIILDGSLNSESKAKVKLLNGFKNTETIFLESEISDTNYMEAIQKGLRAKMLKNFGQINLSDN